MKRMKAIGIISKVTQPTPWCAGIVVVPKPSGAVCICVDLKPLNENVLREVYPIPAVSHMLALLTGAKSFQDWCNSGFWQVPLTSESSLLTIFLTPFGRFYFNKLPFGISSAPKIFQRRMSNTLFTLHHRTVLNRTRQKQRCQCGTVHIRATAVHTVFIKPR